ncbi:zinc c6 transcription factor [Ophiostoma piceae UAMH 11346]|uniref:Zinc c6 transcription factor n=1 Tax=Ophiostoma piceae (strain UAMH 11346) TaxID=1262450 RepID=S3D3K1_OPHP1|nr:zinc c6 transcription factor [Ophiostoma piceae UAMH 11346]
MPRAQVRRHQEQDNGRADRGVPNNKRSKCNQELPCGSCIKRGLRFFCQFASHADRGEKRGMAAKSVSGLLKSLEDLVTKMATSTDAPDTNDTAILTEAVPSVPEPLSEGLLYNANSSYTDSSHWSSLLEEIKVI